VSTFPSLTPPLRTEQLLSDQPVSFNKDSNANDNTDRTEVVQEQAYAPNVIERHYYMYDRPEPDSNFFNGLINGLMLIVAIANILFGGSDRNQSAPAPQQPTTVTINVNGADSGNPVDVTSPSAAPAPKPIPSAAPPAYSYNYPSYGYDSNGYPSNGSYSEYGDYSHYPLSGPAQDHIWQSWQYSADIDNYSHRYYTPSGTGYDTVYFDPSTEIYWTIVDSTDHMRYLDLTTGAYLPLSGSQSCYSYTAATFINGSYTMYCDKVLGGK
jgi:hypothetical protein